MSRPTVGALLMGARIVNQDGIKMAMFQWIGKELFDSIMLSVQSPHSSQIHNILVPLGKTAPVGAIRIDDKLAEFIGPEKPAIIVSIAPVAGVTEDNKQTLFDEFSKCDNKYTFTMGISPSKPTVKQDSLSLVKPAQEIKPASPKTNGHVPVINGNGHSFRHWVEDCVRTTKTGTMRMTLVVLLKILPVTTRNGCYSDKRLPAFVDNCGEDFQTTFKTYRDRTFNCVKCVKSPKRPERKPSKVIIKPVRKTSASRPRKKLEGEAEKTETRVLYERRKRIKAILGL